MQSDATDIAARGQDDLICGLRRGILGNGGQRDTRVIAARCCRRHTLAALLMCWRYGVRRAVRILIVPLGAALITVAALIVLGFAINLFTVCALLLVVGMAFDDAIFFGFHGRRSAPTALAVLLSAATTLISFGLLSLSSTPVVRDFGITLALGVATAYLLAPIAAASAQPDIEGNS
jgi:predicted exporter